MYSLWVICAPEKNMTHLKTLLGIAFPNDLRQFIPLLYPPCPDMRQVLAQGAKVRRHGVPVFGQKPVLPRSMYLRNTCCRHSLPYASKHNNTRQQAGKYPRIPEHMELQLCQHFVTHIDPSCSLHTATNHILYWIGTATTMVPKKTRKCGNTGLLCSDNLVLVQRGVGWGVGGGCRQDDGRQSGCRQQLNYRGPGE